jgi:hypothetical protein
LLSLASGVALLAAVGCAAALLALVGCAARRPVLYPNAHLESVGAEVAQRDIEECIARAEASGADAGHAREVGTRSAEGAVAGGATGAVVGAIRGHPGRDAAAGAGAGATLGLFRGLFSSRERDPVFRNFVDQCLRDRGYQPIGWR